jgi:hypothetical protein
MDHPGGQTTEEIEDEISKVAQPVFNVISEDIKEPHIHDNMEKPSVEKHGGQEREILAESRKITSNFWIGVSEGNDPIDIKDFIQTGTLSELP